jgi:rhodanese-related sulfurtransferase
MPLTAMDLVASAKQHIREVDHTKAKAMLGKAPVLDVREPGEYADGCLPGAVNIPRGVLEFKIDSHPAFQNRCDTEILVYCLSGGRSALAVEALHKLGYEKAVSLAGGYKSWQEAGQPVEIPSS